MLIFSIGTAEYLCKIEVWVFKSLVNSLIYNGLDRKGILTPFLCLYIDCALEEAKFDILANFKPLYYFNRKKYFLL